MRVLGWEDELAKVIAAAETKPFNWGTHDCVTFAADAVRAITGRDPIVDLRGQWDSSLSARKKIRNLGGFVVAVSQQMGMPLAVPRSAGRGDLVLTDDGFLGIVVLSHAVAPQPMGLLRVDMQRWIVSWKVR